MKKKHLLIFVAILVVIGVAIGIYFGFFNNDSVKSVELNLSDLNSGNEFVYCGIPWGSTFIDTRNSLHSRLEKDQHRIPAPEGYAFYVTESPITLNGQQTHGSVQFHNEMLEMIQFSFNVENDYKVWFDNRISDLTGLYGAPSDKAENDNGKMASIVYTWEASDSRLQVSLLTGSAIKTPIISITISIKPAD